MSWLLLAVFVALAGLSAAAWHGQVQRQNDQAFAAQAASVGASVTTAVRRMDDLTLAARTLLAAQSRSHPQGLRELVRRDGRRRALQRRSPGSATSRSCTHPKEKVYPPGKRPYYCLPRLGVSGPGMDEALKEAVVPGFDLCQLTKLLGDTRDSGEFSAFVVSSSHGHEMFEVVAPVYRGGGVPTTTAQRRKLATGWIIGLFDTEPILRSAVAGQPGVYVSLAREHAARAREPRADRRRPRLPHAGRDARQLVGRPLRLRPAAARPDPPRLGRGRRPLDGHGLALARPWASPPPASRRRSCSCSGS